MLWDCSMLCLAQGCKPASNLMMARQLSSWPFFSLSLPPLPSPILLTPVSQERVYNEGWRRDLLRVQRVQNKVLACVSTTGLCMLGHACECELPSHPSPSPTRSACCGAPLLQPLWEKYVERRRRIARECKAFAAREAAGAGGGAGGPGGGTAPDAVPSSPPPLLRTPSGGIPGGKTSTSANEMWLLHGTSGYVDRRAWVAVLAVKDEGKHCCTGIVEHHSDTQILTDCPL